MSAVSQAQQPAKSANRRQLLIAAVLGLISAALVVAYLNSNDNGSSAGVETQKVVVANERIAEGTKITDAMLGTRDVAVSALAPDALRDTTLAAGHVARYPIEKGETLTASRLVDAPRVQSLSFQIPPGLRGMTIPVSIEKTPAALIAPGDFVDVIVSVDVAVLTGRVPPTPSAGGSREFKGAATILQNVQVLSVDRKYADTGVVYDPSLRGQPPGEDDKVSFVTLAVDPDQAQLLWLAQEEGKLTLTLRAFGDNARSDLAPKLEPLTLP